MRDRRKALEMYARDLADGMPQMDEYLDPALSYEKKALRARDLAESALANQVMKNTGVPIPGQGSTLGQKEDAIARIIKERYPEFEPNIRASDMKDYGTYSDGKIELNKARLLDQDFDKSLATALHEAGHQYDDEVLKFPGTPDIQMNNLRKAKESGILSKMDPSDIYETVAKGHHAKIPKLREGSFGLGALKSFMKSGNFKQLAGPSVGLGAALAAGAPSDALAEVVIPGGVGGAGESSEDEAIMLIEADARQNYNKSRARKDALKRLQNK